MPGQTAQEAILAKLAEFATDKTTPPAAPVVPRLLTAKADDLVFAVREILEAGTFAGTDPNLSEAAELAKAALGAQGGKARADRNAIAPRIVDAAVQGSHAADNASTVAEILGVVFNVNAGSTKTALFLTGQVAATAQALKSAEAPGAGEIIAATVIPLISGGDAKVQSFVISTVKAAGADTLQVESFVHRALDNVSNDEAFALNVARGVYPVPAAAGAAIGAYAANLPDDGSITAFARKAIIDPKLAKAIGPIVASTGKRVSDIVAFAQELVSATGLGTKATALNRGAVASGALQVDGAANTDAVIDAVLINKVLTRAELATFAGAAAVGNGANRVAAHIAERFAGADPNLTSQTNIGIAVIKAIALSSPEAAFDVAFDIAEGSLFGTQAAQQQLAVSIAKGVWSTSPKAAGAAVAGVIDHAGGFALEITAAAVRAASKATIGILQEVSLLTDPGVDKVQLAVDLLTKQGVAVSTVNAPSIAAGVALANVKNAADIAVTITNASLATQPKAATIGGSVALAVDVERVADIGQQITGLYSTQVKLPKLSALGTLATSLAKAINTKPLVSHADRVDELGELAASLVDAVLDKRSATPEVSVLSNIGPSIIKGLSSALLINAGDFAADLKDAAQDIAGSIAQTISVSSTLTLEQKQTLLKSGGTIETALKKAAKNFGGEVVTAFDNVRGASNANIGSLYLDGDPNKNEAVGKKDIVVGIAKYEVGWIDDPGHSRTFVPGTVFELSTLNGTNGFRVDGSTQANGIGSAISSAGDVNGDGYDDMIFGAPGVPPAGRTSPGEAYVVFGSASGFPAAFDPTTLDGTNGFRLQREFNNTNAYLGLAVGAAGDVNKDGFADVIVGALEDLGLGGEREIAYVVFGKASGFSPILDLATLDGSNGFEMHTALRGPNGGTLVSHGVRITGAGDVNGDGFDDVVLATANAAYAGFETGSAFVVFSPGSNFAASIDLTTLSGTNGFRVDGADQPWLFGYSVSAAHDINGDGLADILIGAPNVRIGDNRGAAYVVFGRSSEYPPNFGVGLLDGSNGFRIPGFESTSSIANSVAGLGDINGDGFADIAIDAAYSTENGTSSGAAHIVFGKGTPFTANVELNAGNGFKIAGASEYDYAGHVGAAGDVNGDGLADILIGAPGLDANGGFSGGAYVVFGRAGAPTTFHTINLGTLASAAGFRMNGAAANESAGINVTTAGDVNGDGLDDLLIGAPFVQSNGLTGGATYVVLNASVGTAA